MASPWKDAVVVVTGASSGIGLELARHMAPEAKALALVARRRERLEDLAVELREKHPRLEVMVRPTDLADLAQCGAMIDDVTARLGRIGVLVNNAGFGDMGVFDRADWDKIHSMIQVNVTALTYLSQRVFPEMVAMGHGGILNISSGFGLEFLPSFAAYVATKHYVTGLSESLHCEGRPLGVTVTQVCPGPVDTEFEGVLGNKAGRPPPSIAQISAAKCARQALRGFARRRALVIPGFFMKLTMWSGAWSPRWLKRLIYLPVASWFRRRQLAAPLADA
ncbi:MAG: SDR family oxidoreductase [Sandaracinaceae bacterium]|nr:SDR family oxidoreductase [Sandaracinaceae bacterium]